MIIIFIIVLVILLCDHTNESFINMYKYTIPKTIYTYWNDIESNPIIQSHIETWKNNISSDWNIVVISDSNINNYVSREFINKYQSLDVVRFSDFLRLELLKNGGVWMDAGIFIVDGGFLNDYYNEMMQYEYDICLYEYSDRSTTTTQYLENWFFMAPQNSKFIINLYTEFNKAYEMGFLNYKKQILIPSNIDMKYTLQTGDKTYLMQHAIIHYLIKQGNQYKMNIKDANESMFKIQRDNKWEHKNIINNILRNKNWKDFYAVKLTNQTRHFIPDNTNYTNTMYKIKK
jgi:hypothetical protein